jgi:hypothetical protein
MKTYVKMIFVDGLYSNYGSNSVVAGSHLKCTCSLLFLLAE